MKIAITDACIFIDIYELQLTTGIFSLELEIHTSLDVFNELDANQKELLRAFQSVGKLTIHNITSENRIEIIGAEYPRSLSESDKTVLYLAEKIGAMVLSSDKAVRNCAKKRLVEYHGMLWVLDKLIAEKVITAEEASTKLQKLIRSNMVYQNNVELVAEMNKRLKLWSK